MALSCLIQFGRSGFVGRFTSPAPLARGERVIVRGPRGVEPGVVLCDADDRFTPAVSTEGELLRVVEADDDARLSGFPEREVALLGTASQLAAERGLPIAFVDAELTLDDRLILHGLAWDACDVTPLFEELSARFQISVRLLDLAQIPVAGDTPAPDTCGKPNCGSGGSGGCSSCGDGGETGEAKGGCSSGSCSRGKVKSADELTAYFAALRRNMEAASAARVPLT